MPPTIPPADIVAPKHIAQTISQMVSIMPAMPRVAIRPDSMALDVGNDVLPYMLIIEALNRSGWMSRNTSVWKKRPNNIANRVERKRVTNGGQRRAIITPVRSGTRRVSFGLYGGRKAAEVFMKHLKLGSIETHVADSRTCCLHPASSTHRQMTDAELDAAGIGSDLIRLSCGLENVQDLLEDISQALSHA